MKKRKTFLEKLGNSYLFLTLLIILSFYGGFSLIYSPENTPEALIIVIGLLWLVDGFNYIVEFVRKLENKEKW